MARRGGFIEILGLEEAVSAFREVDEAFGATPLKECLIGIAEKMRDRAKALVSIGPGLTSKGEPRPHLRDLIFAAKGKKDSPSVIMGVDRKKAPHAHLVELGHGGPHPAGPHPYLRPAFDEVKHAAKDMAEQEINKRIIRKLTSKRRGLARP